MKRPIRVGIVEDHRMLAQALKLMLDIEEDIRIIGLAGSAEEALGTWVDELDVVLMDVALPGIDGIEATRRLTRSHPETQVVVMTALDDTDIAVQAIEAGATGFVAKTHDAQTLISIIRQAAAGEIVVPQDRLVRTLKRLHEVRQSRADAGRLIESLTVREREVLRLMSEGLSTDEVSRRLMVGPATTRTHIRAILSKLSVHSRLEAVALGLREGIIPPPNGHEQSA
jgi:DNA-binding NarL/FixJ family response regulator